MSTLMPRLLVPQAWRSDPFEDRLALRLAELAADLRLPELPQPAFVPEDALRLGERMLRVPLSLARPRAGARGNTAADPVDLAERVSAAACSARWGWLAPCLSRPTPALRAASDAGLDLEDLRSLQPLADDPAACGWAVGEQVPASVAVLLPPEDLDHADPAQVATTAAELLGLPVAPPLLEADVQLAALTLRLRIRRLRLPPRLRQPDERGPRLTAAIVQALQRDAAMLVDAQALAALMLDADDAPPALLQRMLLSPGADLALIAQALARCCGDGLRITHPALLRHALLDETWAVDDPAPGRYGVALPGVVPVARASLRTDAWAARLRAALIGPTLAAAGLEFSRAVWTLSPSAAQAARRSQPADLDRLARLALPCARADGVLLAPNGEAMAVRQALRHDLPTLLVCEEQEWPRELKPALRGTIDHP